METTSSSSRADEGVHLEVGRVFKKSTVIADRVRQATLMSSGGPQGLVEGLLPLLY